MRQKLWLVWGLVLGWGLLLGGRQLGAATAVFTPHAPAAPPSLISFQGFLSDSNGDPVADGSYLMNFAIYDAASGGALIWAESQSSVPVSGGVFAVMLGSGNCTDGCPLGSDTFAESNRYLQVSADVGNGLTTFPRQQFGSVPYALQAPTDSGATYENVLTVATGGGDFTSVAAALASITDNSATNRYLVRVMPGVYTETELVTVKSYVHVQGAGPNATVITSARTGGSPGSAVATVDLLDNGRLTDITIRNTGTGTYGIALYSAQTSRAAVVDNVVAEAIGAGGTGHYAAYWNDAEATIRDSSLYATGATGFGTGVNAALGIVNISGGFPQPLITNSRLIGGNGSADGLSCAGNSGTGFAIQGVNAAPQVFDSYLCGDRRGIFLGTNGQTRLHNSQLWVSSTGGSFMVETTTSAAVIMANSGVFYTGNKYTGTGGLVCVNSYTANYTPASDGTTSATACN